MYSSSNLLQQHSLSRSSTVNLPSVEGTQLLISKHSGSSGSCSNSSNSSSRSKVTNYTCIRTTSKSCLTRKTPTRMTPTTLILLSLSSLKSSQIVQSSHTLRIKSPSHLIQEITFRSLNKTSIGLFQSLLNQHITLNSMLLTFQGQK